MTERFLAQRPCAKCGAKDCTARLCATGTFYRRAICDVFYPHPEHIRRHCRRCGHEWDEAPLDAANQAACAACGHHAAKHQPACIIDDGACGCLAFAS